MDTKETKLRYSEKDGLVDISGPKSDFAKKMWKVWLVLCAFFGALWVAMVVWVERGDKPTPKQPAPTAQAYPWANKAWKTFQVNKHTWTPVPGIESGYTHEFKAALPSITLEYRINRSDSRMGTLPSDDSGLPAPDLGNGITAVELRLPTKAQRNTAEAKYR
jgi:hypothetical protein